MPTTKASVKERLMIKSEPGVANEVVMDEPVVEEEKSVDVFEDVPEGLLGSLNLHKSGKMTLQIGEQHFVIDSAAQISYLQVSDNNKIHI